MLMKKARRRNIRTLRLARSVAPKVPNPLALATGRRVVVAMIFEMQVTHICTTINFWISPHTHTHTHTTTHTHMGVGDKERGKEYKRKEECGKDKGKEYKRMEKLLVKKKYVCVCVCMQCAPILDMARQMK